MSISRKKATVKSPSSRLAHGKKPPLSIGKFQDALTMAEESGLLEGARTRVLRGRMPKALVENAKANPGAKTDTELIEIALAHVATADEYATWLLSRRGSIPRDIDLEF